MTVWVVITFVGDSFRRVRCEYFGIELVRVYIDSKIDEQERRALTCRWEETTWNGLQEGFA